MLTRNYLYHGSDAPLPSPTRLRAGPLELLFEDGDLRTLRLGGQEIVRRIYVAVRDKAWGTIPAQYTNLRVQVDQDTFTIDYDVTHQAGEIDFAWHGTLRGGPDGHISFAMDGVARSTFLKNRIGFCVLFPAGLAGCPVELELADGTRQRTTFPQDICADQPVSPFENLSAITLPVDPAGEAAVRFSGDLFEMEDQRLWTDASYKVFCTPLALPYPVIIQAGTRVRQQIDVQLPLPAAGQLAELATSVMRPQPGVEEWLPIPELGLGQASHGLPLTQGEFARLQALHLHQLRLDIHPADYMDDPMELIRQIGQAGALGLDLEVALHITPQTSESELTLVHEMMRACQIPICRWLVYPAQELYAGGSPTAAVLAAARQHLQAGWPEVPFAAGTNTDFIFAKRTPPPLEQIDAICIALNPQVHAFDNRSLLETCEGQQMVVESARRLAGGRPVAVSPLTLKPRFNPHILGPQPQPALGNLPEQVDPRQRSLFGAVWTLASLRSLVLAGAESLTLFETTGWRGVMEREAGSPWPLPHPALLGVVYPLYHVLADLGEFVGGQAAAWSAPDSPLLGLALRREGRLAWLIANPSETEQILVWPEAHGPVSLRVLDETNGELAMRQPEQYRSHLGELFATPQFSPPSGGSAWLAVHSPASDEKTELERGSTPDRGSHTLRLPPYGLVRLDFENWRNEA